MHTDYRWTKAGVDSAEYDFPGLQKYLDKEKNGCILDLGCGNGTIALELLKRGFNVYGIDASETGVEMANDLYGQLDKGDHTTRFFVCDFDEAWALPDIKFDTIISTQVIEHVYSPNSYIQLCQKILPIGGRLLITAPYHGYLKNLALAITGKMDAHFTALWEGGHIKFFSKKTISALLTRNGFHVIDFAGLGRMTFLWKSMLIVAEKRK